MAVLILFCNPKRMTKRLYNRVIQSSRFEAFRGAVSMAVSLYLGILDSEPFCHISETAKAANHGVSAESTLYFDYYE
jgi:hypothetical protein